MMAVMMPFSGETPDAMPKAIASGRATMPTMMPAMRSAVNFSRESVLCIYIDAVTGEPIGAGTTTEG